MNFVAIDFETANEKRNSACSVAVVEVKEGKLYDSFYALIRPPELRFAYRNIEVHGITAQDVRNQPEFPFVWQKLAAYLENKIVIAHNASFDMSVLKNCLQTYSIPMPNFQHCCTVRIARKVWPDLENHKLNTLGNYFHIDFNHHNALDDARTCAAVALLAGKACKTPSFAEMVAKLHVAVNKF